MEQAHATSLLQKHGMIIQIVEEEINPQPNKLIHAESPTAHIALCFVRELIEQLNQQHKVYGSNP